MSESASTSLLSGNWSDNNMLNSTIVVDTSNDLIRTVNFTDTLWMLVSFALIFMMVELINFTTLKFYRRN